MRSRPTLRQEFLSASVLVFAGALVVAAIGILLLLPRLETPGSVALYIGSLLLSDVVIFAQFGRALLKRRLLAPLEELVVGVEAIAQGDYGRRLPAGETEELARVSEAVNRMAERLIKHREQLAANVRSLEETNRRLTEARDELIRAERLASVGRLGAGIAHEVGNPLSAIIGYLGLLQRSVGEREREWAEAAEAEARRIDRIVRGLLNYARPGEARVHAIDVNGVVERTLELVTMQGRLQGIALVRVLSDELPAVSADPHQLEQVLVNLILNATDALEGVPSPSLEVTTTRRVHQPRPPAPPRRRDDPPDVDYSHRRRFHHTPRVPREDPFRPGGVVVEIRVADNGPGIAPELLDQVFEPFVTTKEPGKGTGLGLAVAARLIDAMGGTIRVENGEQGGAVFTIVLPAAVGVEAESKAGVA